MALKSDSQLGFTFQDRFIQLSIQYTHITVNCRSNLSATGSSSPKQKSKKQAPAPPKSAAASAQNDSMTAAGNTSLLSTSLVESTHSLSSNSSLHNVSVSSQQRSTDATTHENNVSSSNSGANIMSKLTSRRFIFRTLYLSCI